MPRGDCGHSGFPFVAHLPYFPSSGGLRTPLLFWQPISWGLVRIDNPLSFHRHMGTELRPKYSNSSRSFLRERGWFSDGECEPRASTGHQDGHVEGVCLRVGEKDSPRDSGVLEQVVLCGSSQLHEPINPPLPFMYFFLFSVASHWSGVPITYKQNS